jgi:predicted DNA-binding WGR domain protein
MGQDAGNLQMLVLERRDSHRNLARFYVLAIEPTLLGDSALVREWGRIGTLGRRRLDLLPLQARLLKCGWRAKLGVVIE